MYHEKNLTPFYQRIKNLVSLAKYRFRENKQRFISIILSICLIFSLVKVYPKDLKIYFIDVGQGDSTLIVTPLNKRILIDGGGSEFGDFNVGESTLLPYLLDRGIKKLDYIILTHFDLDHVQAAMYVIRNIKVDKVIIPKQIENSEAYSEFVSIVKERVIDVSIVKSGDRINIEKDLYFDVLWPNDGEFITENAMNNNSIVCKLRYKNLSVLFTGDIEEIAEEKILELYKNNLNILQSTVLKVAHHGSKSSSIKEFLDAVKPKFAFIGAGKNNLYGHPASEVIERLYELRCRYL